MTLNINPPPIQIPPDLAGDKTKNKFFSGLINTIYQLWTRVYGLRVDFKTNTTDNTPTAALRIPIDSGKTVMVNAYVVAQNTSGDSAWYRLMGAYKNISGTLTGIGTPGLIGGEDQASWNFSFSSSGQEILLVVTGAASNDITWEGSAETYVVGA